jgi:PhnB protein
MAGKATERQTVTMSDHHHVQPDRPDFKGKDSVMIATNTYLNFNGTCEEAMNFYATLLGGNIVMMMKAKGSPMEKDCPQDFLDKIMHARMTLGNNVLMGSDATTGRYHKPQGFSVSLSVEDPGEADRIYAGLAQGGEQTMPIQETFWARRFGMCVDRFGTPWMVNCEKEM